MNGLYAPYNLHLSYKLCKLLNLWLCKCVQTVVLIDFKIYSVYVPYFYHACSIVLILVSYMKYQLLSSDTLEAKLFRSYKNKISHDFIHKFLVNYVLENQLTVE